VTEPEWEACDDPRLMLPEVLGAASPRRLRLFAAAFWRSWARYLPSPLPAEPLLVACGLAERWADDGRRPAGAALYGGYIPLAESPRSAAEATVRAAARGDDPQARAARAYQVQLLRCLFGNPLRPSPPLPEAVLAWDDRLVPRLAQAIYDEGRWQDLPLLADALLDAGCDNDEVLAHLRGPGPHARGCWVLDLLTGRG
jgi:hypothetical protein